MVRSVFFDPKFPNLKKPDDDVLKEAFDFIGVETSGSEQRNTFFCSWAAEMACLSVGSMLSFLQDNVPPSAKVALHERDRLSDLLKYPLTSSLECQISAFIDYLQNFLSKL